MAVKTILLSFFFTLSDSFTCFVLISHLKSPFIIFCRPNSRTFALTGCRRDFAQTYPAAYFRPKSNLCASHPLIQDLLAFYFFFHLSPICFNWPKFRTIRWAVVFFRNWCFLLCTILRTNFS